MKRILLFVPLALLLALPLSSHAARDEAVLSVPLQVDGMTCIGCAANVKRALKSVPGVSSVKVSFERNEAVVAYEKDKVTVERLIQAVEKAGYKASKKQ